MCQKVAMLWETPTVATRRERLRFKIWQIIEGEAEGRLAICALVGVVAGTLLLVWLMK